MKKVSEKTTKIYFPRTKTINAETLSVYLDQRMKKATSSLEKEILLSVKNWAKS